MSDNPYTSGELDVEAPLSAPSNRPHTFAVGMTLLVTSIGWVFGLMFAAAYYVLGLLGGQAQPKSYAIVVVTLLVYNMVLAVGAVGILRQASYRFAITVFCMAIIPFTGPFYLIGTGVGIWGLLALRKPEAKACFEKQDAPLSKG